MRYRNPIRALSLCATLAPLSLQALDIPLEPDGWQVLAYRNIPNNQVRFLKEGMEVQVDGSAGAIIFPLSAPDRFNKLHVRAKIQGTINLDGHIQGERGSDDFRLRIGLVYAGQKTLNFLQWSIAPRWIRKLYALAPKDTGISRVEFYNTWQHPSLKGQQRFHPTTSLWREHFLLMTDPEGGIDQSLVVPTDADVIAVWISIDGDDTDSSYQVTIQSLVLDLV